MKFGQDLKKGKFLGHPIHVMLIHFPMALLPAAFLLQLFSCIQMEPSWALMGFYCMASGTAAGYIAAIFGTIDLMQLLHRQEVLKKAGKHALLNLAVIMGYTILCAMELKHYPKLPVSSPVEIFLNGLLVVLLLISAHIGGDLIFKDKVGITED